MSIMDVLNTVTKLLGERRGIFDHKATGDPCPICGKRMKPRHRIVRTMRDGRMHADCWPESLKRAIKDIAARAAGSGEG